MITKLKIYPKIEYNKLRYDVNLILSKWRVPSEEVENMRYHTNKSYIPRIPEIIDDLMWLIEKLEKIKLMFAKKCIGKQLFLLRKSSYILMKYLIYLLPSCMKDDNDIYDNIIKSIRVKYKIDTKSNGNFVRRRSAKYNINIKSEGILILDIDYLMMLIYRTITKDEESNKVTISVTLLHLQAILFRIYLNKIRARNLLKKSTRGLLK